MCDRIATWDRWICAGDPAMTDQIRSAVSVLGLPLAATVLRVPIETLREWSVLVGE